jgi:2-polyprenyl-3-methyl-5-hydroxy-6-metoxy-1,4-benzoquinol methylase
MAVPAAGERIWRCPRCRGSLAERSHYLVCEGCGETYPVFEGIPDLRIGVPAWIDFDEDRRRALEVFEAIAPEDVAGAVRFVFGRREGWSDALVERRVQQVLELPARLRSELDGWLAPLARDSGVLLDLGCGAGVLLAAVAAPGRSALGVDVSMEWLVVAQRMIRAEGGQPVLACAVAESLPLPDGAVTSVAVLDVIEHVSRPSALVREVNRVLAPGGVVLLSTPNRFSLAAEPHVGIWGVGWLPAKFQDRFVRWRSGKPYAFTHLLSRRGLAKLFERHSSITIRIEPATIPDHELRRFPRRRTIAATVYNSMVSKPLLARLILPASPFFHLVGRRR